MFSTLVICDGDEIFLNKFRRSFVFFSLLVVIVKSIAADKVENETICSTPGCENAGNLLKNNINEQIDPCSDFYHFACGGFLDRTSIPENQHTIGHVENVQNQIITQIRDALEEQVDPSEPRIFELAKNYYKSCLNESTREQNLQNLLHIIQQLGGWPVLEGTNWKIRNFSLIKTDIELRKLGYKPNRIFKIFAFPHLINHSESVLSITPPSPVLRSHIFKRGLKNPIVQAYYNYMVDVAVLLGADKDVAKEQLRRVVYFEKDVAVSITDTAFLNVVNMEPIAKLYEQADYPWLKYINGMTEPIVHFRNHSLINVNNETSLFNYAKLLHSQPKRTIANYMIWKVIAESIKYLPDEYRDKAFEFEKIQSERLAYPPKPLRWGECVGLTIDKAGGLVVAASSMYIRKHFNDSFRNEVEPIMSSIFEATREVLNKTTWMSDAVRALALQKIDYIRRLTAYPSELLNDTAIDDYSRNLTISPNDHFQNFLNLQRFHHESDLSALHKSTNEHYWPTFSDSIQVNAYYHAALNTFIVLAAILQEPLFNPVWPSYVRFGSAGFIIAHEIMHAYDPPKFMRTGHGNLLPSINDTSKDTYSDRAVCLLDSNVHYRDRGRTDLNLNLTLTLFENVADNGGVKVAYLAYRKWVAKNGEDPRPSQLQKYSADQLFFVGLTNFLCSKTSIDQRKDDFKHENHGPNDMRSYIMLKNSQEFAEAYNCPVTSRMNPQKKCNIWK